MTTLKEFLAGTPLRYAGYDRRPCLATYQPGTGIVLERKNKVLGVAAVPDALGATRFYHNATRRPARAEKEE